MPLTREDKFNQTGEIFTKIGLLFKDAEKATDLNERIDNASILFKQIAELAVSLRFT